MQWTKDKGPFPGWHTACDYRISDNTAAHSALYRFCVLGPRAAKPPHYRARVGGCNSLTAAKQMAEDHNQKN